MKNTLPKTLALGLTAGVLVGLAGFAPAQAHDGPRQHGPEAQLSVFHGVPGLVVDVYVNNELTLDDFEPGSFAGPLDLPAGTYTVAITAADAADASAPAIGPVDLTLTAGTDYTVAAHLTEAGAPTATLFTNDTSRLKRGEGRLTVRHIAAAPAVDVLAGGAAAVSGLVNPHEAVLALPAGVISAAVAAAGTTEPLIGPADVDVAKRTNTIVYAWGSLSDDSLNLAVQTVATDKQKNGHRGHGYRGHHKNHSHHH
ncbi:DUF4397 domain-containing protein [Cryobacterium melibiosiphilum]|uniref:DUF4397 domain-containing protein n=1 Tax=Cryobacterium melibiosiphilum TaxID=995039 RepID=A0A3A5MPP8_9MICO|nr:DUF4397 domain-containing protein [Cryobacterium melibiosiphilum]RJT88046.1 DUF4397 domain-containing protein [Cryobacterium melibiosiphilum]